MDKPVQVGFAIVEISKLLMLEFYYDYFKIKYPKARILYTDTDSFIIEVPTKDFYKDMESEPIHQTIPKTILCTARLTKKS